MEEEDSLDTFHLGVVVSLNCVPGEFLSLGTLFPPLFPFLYIHWLCKMWMTPAFRKSSTKAENR